MALGDMARQAIHAATGVPRLYAAARKAGLGTGDALEVLLVSRAALSTAATHGRGVPGRTNAMRHFLWQAVLTARFGLEAARTIAAEQEVGTPDAADSRVDRHNNTVGREWGAAHAEELASGSVADAVSGLVPVALAKWESEELAWVRRPRR